MMPTDPVADLKAKLQAAHDATQLQRQAARDTAAQIASGAATPPPLPGGDSASMANQ